jgi:hypothetical protein
MTKYCPKCGSQSDDQAAFCTACGEALPDAQAVTAQRPGQSYLVEMVIGEHKHLRDTFEFRDSSGKTAYAVTRASMIHMDYNILDAGGQTVGRLSHRTHLTQTAMEVYDSGQNLVFVIHFEGRQPGTAFPNCWVEDASGNAVATVTYSFPINFEVSRPGGQRVMTATLALEGGLLRDFEEIGASRCNIQVLEPFFPGWQAAGIFVAAQMGRLTVGSTRR